MRPAINWMLIGRAIDVYQHAYNYRYVEAPWIVPKSVIEVTLPPGRSGIHCEDGALVGSAEQSFIHMMLEGELEVGRYMAATPCFRDEVPEDELHLRRFFKVELIEVLPGPTGHEARVQAMAQDALSFFAGTYDALASVIVPTEQGLDIELHGVELGSYGYREHRGHHWIYGTGIAEPRFSQAVARGRRR